MSEPPEINPRQDRYDAALPTYGVTFLRQRVFRVLRDGPRHLHADQTQVLIVLAGRLALRLDSTFLRLAPGEALVVPMGVSHHLVADGDAAPLEILDLRVVGGAQHDVGRTVEALPARKRLKLDPAVLAGAVAGLAAAERTTGWPRPARLLSSLWQLLAALELSHGETPVVGDRGVRDHRLRRAEAFIVQNLAEDVGVDQIAAAAGLSRSQLARLYRQELGVGPAERLRACRINTARRLLASGRLSVKEVARAVGFRWVHHFIRTYNRARGHTPSVDLGVDD